ncbi:MAG: VPS10 domain-containing protein [Aureliella sp.]
MLNSAIVHEFRRNWLEQVQLWTICLAVLTPSMAVAQDEEKADKPGATEPASPPAGKVTTGDVSALKMRSIGPALLSGRIGDVVVNPDKPNTWYVGAASGNIWKTENSGTTWDPIFENYGSYSIGCLAIDPSNTNTIWVGTGENNGGRHIGFGDGVYVSHNGGKSFKNVGLKASEHIGEIIVDPLDSNTVYVASQGPLWSSGGERGLYKTVDGGETWDLILSKGEWTGVTDIALDHDNPDIIYACTHQRHRTVWGLVNGGPESGVFKSVDGGETWNELKSGIPGGDKGKMSIAVSPQRSNVVYVTIELPGRTGGVFRSEDWGESWKKMSDYVGGGTGPHYYQEIYCDPHRFDVLYHANVYLGRSQDGGATWEQVESGQKHVDNHAVAFHPTDEDFVLVGCDGGVYRSYDFAKTYQFVANLPLTQFYKVAVSYEEPFYHVAGGTQDNYSQYGPSRTRDTGILNRHWRVTIGGDGHDAAIDPEDPNIIYGESQQGFIRRFDRRTGETVDIKPQPGADEEDLRHNWDSPIEISPHSHTRIYFGSKKLHRSDDRGDSWTTISPDLSRNIDRFTLKHMDRVWSIDATYDLFAMSQYGNITSIDESPVEEGLIYVGTDDGLIRVTEDGGETWSKVDKIFGVPEFFFVNDIKADRFDANVVYAAVDNHKTGDYKPYLLKSSDRGKTWESISGDLPDRHLCWRLIQDHVNPNLLFAGTEYGAFFTVDGGEHWAKLPGTPVIPFRDLEIQRVENDLVGATFGRGFYVLDDYTPLRTIDPSTFKAGEFVLFDTRPAKLYVEDGVLGGGVGFQGDATFMANNPPFGAVFTYYLPESLKTAKQKRREKESKVAKDGGDNPPPSWDKLHEEELEESPEVILTIRNADGDIVNRVSGPTSKGMHRVAWGLRYGGSRRGPFAVPGEYTVEVSQRLADEVKQLAEPQSFEVVAALEPTLEPKDRTETLEFQMALGELQRRVVGAAGKLSETLDQLSEMKSAIKRSRTIEVTAYDKARLIEVRLKEMEMELTGDQLKSEKNQVGKRSVLERIQTALFGTLGQTYGPTQTHRDQAEIAEAQYGEIVDELRGIIEEDFAELQSEMDEAGVPWTSGRAFPE